MADVDQLTVLVEAVNRSSAELRKVAADIAKIDAAAGSTSGVNRFNSSMDNSVKSAVKFAGAFISVQAGVEVLKRGLTGTIGAAIDFESSFAGIRKTVDASEADFNKLAQANRNLAKEIPATANEINRVGELAGQLGVTGVDNIAKFERVIIDLANTTDLTADSAATSFAQLANVMQLPVAQLDRAGAALVELGNKSAATESEILAFSTRIAGAGKIAGLTVAEVEGIGAAFASTGVEAEAGGTAIQKVLIEMTKSAATGSKELSVFAETAGLSVDAFAKLAKSDPSEAFTLFVEGLGKAGDKAFGILERLGLEDQRLIRSFLAVAGAGDLLRDSIETGTQAFAANTALTTEAEKRYATTAAQLKILKNNLTDVGISIGQEVLPAINESSRGAVTLIGSLAPVGPAFEQVARAAPLAVAGMIAFTLASKAVQAGVFAAEVSTLSREFPNLTRQMVGTTGAFEGLRKAVFSPLGATVALTGAIAALDFGMKKFSGESIIETLSEADEKARGAAEAMGKYEERLANINSFVSSGANPFLAQSLGIEAFIEQIQSLDDELQALQPTIDTLFGERRATGLLIDSESLTEAQAGIDALIPKLGDLVRAAKDPEAAIAQFREEIEKLPPELQTRLLPALDAIAIEYHDLAHASESAEEAQVRLALATSGFSDEAIAAGIALNDLTVAADANADGVIDLGEAYDALTDAVNEFQNIASRRTAAEVELDLQIAKVEALIGTYERAGDEVPKDLAAWLEALRLNREGVQNLEDITVLAMEHIGREFEEAGLDGQQVVKDLTAALEGLPEETRLNILTKLDQGGIDAVEAYIVGIEVRDVILRVIEHFIPADHPQDSERSYLSPGRGHDFASGVRNFHGGIALVGERGPEIVELPRGANVYSHEESQRMLSGTTPSGGTASPNVVNVYGNIILPNVREPDDFARELAREHDRNFR